jgi:hypothetical protein
LSDTSLAPAGPPRHGLAEGLIGGALALAAIGFAHAALPDPPKVTRPAPARIALALAQPPTLIAFTQPLPDGEVGSPFGLRQLPWEETARLHAGLDIVAPDPEPVLAAADGVVTRLGQDPGYGRFVELKHAEGLVTRYGHLERFAEGLAPGDAVKAGTPIGRLGSTGTSTGVHLHFEIRDAADRPMNPAMFLGRAFATAAELPLAAARRTPRQVRVAYVSRIPKTKQAQMQAKLSAEAASEAGGAVEIADGGLPAGPVSRHHAHGRVHARFNL